MTANMKRRIRALATLDVVIKEMRDPHSTASGIFNDSVLDDLEFLRDELSMEHRNAVALKPIATSASSMLALRFNKVN